MSSSTASTSPCAAATVSRAPPTRNLPMELTHLVQDPRFHKAAMTLVLSPSFDVVLRASPGDEMKDSLSSAARALINLLALFDIVIGDAPIPFLSALRLQYGQHSVTCTQVVGVGGTPFITSLIDSQEELLWQAGNTQFAKPVLTPIAAFVHEKLLVVTRNTSRAPAPDTAKSCPTAAVMWLFLLAKTDQGCPTTNMGVPIARVQAKRDFTLKLVQHHASQGLALDVALSKLNEATRGDFEHVKIRGHSLSWAAENNIPAHCLIKILVLGNSGRGKSFLINTMCGQEVFKHASQGQSCTRDVTGVIVQVPKLSETMYYALYDVPGLMEADPAKVEDNRNKIRSAVEQFPGSKTAVILMFGAGAGGRVSSEDVECFAALQSYLDFNPAKVTMVLNNVPDTGSDDDDTDFRMNWFRFASRIIRTEQFPHFVTNIRSHRIRTDYFSQPTLDAAQTMLVATHEAITNAQLLKTKGSIELVSHKLENEKAAHKKEREARDAEQRQYAADRLELLRKQQEKQRDLDNQLAATEKARVEEAAEYNRKLAAQKAETQRLQNNLSTASCCFDGATTTVVRVDEEGDHQGEQVVLMRDIVPGDVIRTRPGKQEFSTVYYAGSHGPARGVEIQVEQAEDDEVQLEEQETLPSPSWRRDLLRLTWDHSVLVRRQSEDRFTMVAAGTVRVGDWMQQQAGEEWKEVRVTAVELAEEDIDRCSVLTFKGTVLANGLVCSCFEGTQWFGHLENLDMMAAYAIGGKRLVMHPLWQKYADAAEKLAQPLRRWIAGREKDLVKTASNLLCRSVSNK